MVKKALDNWRMCVDFTNLNLASPKDSYPLPSINMLIDRSTGNKILSFMDALWMPHRCFTDAHSGYNQVKMSKEDKEKTAFIT